ncbi:DNA binding protein [Gordonia phage WilliamBoone]|nr:DNA binding protein [Gordonia phage WilliamBoone]
MAVVKDRRKYDPVTPGMVLYMQRRAEEGATLREMAQELNISMGSAWRHAHEYLKNKPQPKGRPDITIQHVLDALDAAGSQRKASKELGCSLTLVRQRLWEAGLGPDPKNRGRGEYKG